MIEQKLNFDNFKYFGNFSSNIYSNMNEKTKKLFSSLLNYKNLEILRPTKETLQEY